MKCRICTNTISSSFSEAQIYGRTVKYYECDVCAYVQTEEPTWLSQAYSEPITSSDTGIMARNISNVDLVLSTLTLLQERKGKVVDYAGGHGFLVRLLRDKGVEALWADLYSKNLVARHFEYKGEEQISLVMAFEAFEHFLNPGEEMSKLVKISSNILLTTTLLPRPTPLPVDWWYYGLEHGQHIGFYRIDTLKYLANKFGLNFLSDGVSAHLFTKEKHNLYTWKLLRRTARWFPMLFSGGLSSKTISDHLLIEDYIKNKTS